MSDDTEFTERVTATRAGLMQRSANISNLAMALAKAQGAMEVAAKDSQNPFFRSSYADFASIREAARKPLADNGLAFTQLPRIEVQGAPEFQIKATRSGDERVVVKAMTTVYVTTLLMHESGEWIENELFTIIPAADPQSIGSAVTYLRRYALGPMVGVAAANEDDDGNAATQPRGETPRRVAPAPDGFDSWFMDIEAKADEGYAELMAAWRKANPAFKNAVVSAHRETWEKIQTKARGVDAARRAS